VTAISDFIGGLLVLGGAIFTMIGSIGLVRMPDFYTRAHAASKPDTMGVVLSMAGLAVIAGPSTTGAKLLGVALFLAIGGPAAIHALGASALRSGLVPWSRSAKRDA
jgi:multicomponent Na+:H+ antiporter subunit G